MKRFRRIGVIEISYILMVFLLAASSQAARSQVKYYSEEVTIYIKGTSSLQNWELKSDKGQMEAVFGVGKNYKITDLYTFWFSVETESLKSGEKAMENTVYKTLKAKTYDNISFVHKSSTVTPVDSNHFDLKCTGYLTVAGSEQETELVVRCKVNDDKTITGSGSKKLKITDFNLNPPSGPLGTLKVGDEILIAYQMNIAKKS